ncbi:arsinothricin resistance N-acetyltransferase ArsN1 family B [Pseudomonas gingeri]|uniref:arsinothricin resistance N-acetyltransferase ArsN1 family B n=1 Tax=Pseudomonas gingeri TaxID=117681 RepID=UPI00159FEEA0|nr:arsinothricin resistance N-acetyltransferase ArsN1 family B [Pseudomonas gingeri]NWD06351.1 N-acetyltransferase family protein [Pseudomonas gingeri]NWE32810.1 N-acetyltransferase family protein [Pseudomonas gingeri]NWE60423.1 N-acetyltransferase family protein [Pseudomonas gingeri]NWF05003.1 N-acetyltransferase family protein [Pseudomonas gingeri]
MALNIRTAVVADAHAIQGIYAPIVLKTAISFEEAPPSVEDIAQRIATTLQTYPYLVAEEDGEIKGYAYASQHRARPAYRWAVDVTVYIAESARRQGVGRQLYETMLPILDKQRFRAAYAGIAQPNEGSVGLHESLGFVHIGTYPEVGFKLGKWHDVGYWRLGLCQSTPPLEPLLFPQLEVDSK